MSVEDLAEAKLRAEIDKLHAETEAVRRSRWLNIGEFLKVLGAVTATLAAGYAAITTYRVTQLETRLALVDKQRADEARAQALRALNSAQDQVRSAVVAKVKAERELSSSRQSATIAGDARRRAEHDRDVAISKLRAEQLAVDTTVRRNNEVQAQLAQISARLERLRSEMIATSLKKVEANNDKPLEMLQQLSLVLDSEPLSSFPRVGIIFNIGSFWERDSLAWNGKPDKQAEVMAHVVAKGIVPIPLLVMAPDRRPHTIVMYHEAEAKDRAEELLQILKAAGLPYATAKYGVTNDTPIRLPGLTSSKPLSVEVLFGEDAAVPAKVIGNAPPNSR